MRAKSTLLFAEQELISLKNGQWFQDVVAMIAVFSCKGEETGNNSAA